MPLRPFVHQSFFLALLSLFAATLCNGQITGSTNDQATPLPGTGHDYIKTLSETVQPASGSLSVRIDVPSLKTRNTFPFAYLYNSPGVHHVVAIGQGKAEWTSDNGDSLGQGWSNNLPTITAIQAVASTAYPGPPPYTATCTYFTSYIFQDSTGARHALPLQTAQSNDANSPNHCSQVVGAPDNILAGGDGIFNASTTAPPVDTVPQNPPAVTVVGPDGTVYGCGALSQVYVGWTTAYRSSCAGIGDRNGNALRTATYLNFQTTPQSVPWNFTANFVTQDDTGGHANCFGISNASGSISGYQSISLPNGKSYQFQYDTVYGLLNKITYPSGGYVSYTWGLNPIAESLTTKDAFGLVCTYGYDTPAIMHRYVSFDGVNVALQQDFSYSTTWSTSAPGNWTAKQTTVTTRDLVRGVSYQTVYNYAPIGGPGAASAVESSVIYKDFNGSTLSTVNKGWISTTQLLCELKTLPNGSISGAFYAYGAGSQLTDKKEYDFGQITSSGACYGAGSSLPSPPSGVIPARETVTTYQVFPSNPSIYDRPSTIKTYGNGVLVAETDYSYDQTSVVAVSPTPTGHDETNYGALSTIARGNATTVTRVCFQGATACTNAVSTFTFDETGHIVSKTDPCGNSSCADMTGTSHTTTYSYADSYTTLSGGQNVSYTPTCTPSPCNMNAFLTKVTDPLGHTKNLTYDFNNGQLTISKDENSLTTSYVYNDSLARLTQINSPDGGQTTVSYNDTAPSPSVTTTKKINSSQSVTSVAILDGLGHVVKSKICEDGPTCAQPIQADTTYDGMSRVHTVSNPYRSTSDSTYGITTSSFDAIGRKTSTTYPDGSVQSTSYSSATTTVTDPTGRVRRSSTDGLGRLVEVDEPGTGAVVGTPGSGTVTLSGAERSTTVSTASTGWVNINIAANSYTASGTLRLIVNGSIVGSFNFPSGGAPGCALLTFLTNSTNSNSSSPVSAALTGCSGTSGPNGRMNLTSKTTGSVTNYSFTANCVGSCPFPITFSGSTMTGGTGPTTIFDTGTISVSISGVAAATTYGQSDTSATLATKLASAINASSAPASAVSNGSTINLVAKVTGAATDYPLSVSSATTSSNFTGTSFSIAASGATLTGGSDPTFGTTPFVTLYLYDILGNMTCAVQKGADTTAFSTCAAAPAAWRPRSFTYDSLSRMLTSTNPEVGTLTYTYDTNGNVSTKKDARNITTTYGYDVLNRTLSVSYSNSDPGVTIAYDQPACLGLTACQNIGQRTSMTDAAGSESWAYQVDPTNLRSVHANLRTNTGIPGKTSTYFLDLAGNLTQIDYPTGRIVNYAYDNAGRPATATDSANGITYASGTCGSAGTAACYAPHGAISSAKIGVSSVLPGGLVLTDTYNNRLQPNELKASSAGGNAFDISYNFVDPASLGNAGHVYGITNNIDATRSQVFTYDPLNRIASAKTTSTHATSAAHCWGEVFTIDPWANLQTVAATTDPAYTGCTQESGFTKTPDNSNHLSGLGYDLSGNTTSDGSFTYTWDGESQLKTAGGVTYTYDGNGRRVSKSNGKYYWYGSGGEILAETTATGVVTNEYIFFGGKRVALLPAGSTAQFYAEDLLGTSRVVTTNAGVVCYDADFYPFGGERTVTTTCSQNAYKFEGKERDAETGNDDFGARYYSNRFGRWLSADWSNVPVPVPYANLTNPQTLNLYAMVSDDPETFADLDGHGAANGGCEIHGLDCGAVEQQQNDKDASNSEATARAGETNYNYYDVQGATASEAMANANKSPHGGCSAPSAGCTSAEYVQGPTTQVKGEKTSSGASVTGTVIDVKVTVTITTTLPNWTGYAGASASEQKAWDSSLAALKTHEDGHAAIDRAGVKEIKSAILGTTATASGASFKQAQSKMLTKLGDLVATKFNTAIAANQKRNDDYDLANK